MSITKNEIPILEYDTDPKAVIMPDHEHLAMELPEKAVFAFLGGAADRHVCVAQPGVVILVIPSARQSVERVTERKCCA